MGWNGRDRSWDFLAEDDAVAALHDEKRGAEDGGVLADDEGFGRLRVVRMGGAEHVVFAHHVVRLGGYRSERGATEDVLAVAGAEEVSEIGVPVGELLDGEIAGGVQPAAEEIAEGIERDFF